MSRFTPGEWEVEEASQGYIRLPGGKWCNLSGFITTEEVEANARLIAAEPELYELLMECADALETVGLPTLSQECYELLASIDGEEASQ